MKQFSLFLFTVFCISIASGQSRIIYETFYSAKMDQDRKLKIQLPRDYETNTEKVYPIVVVLDGNYLFEPVAGNVDYFSYWEDMPESLVVGIMQGDQRYDDCDYDDTTFFPSDTGSKFFEFIGMELIQYLDENYRTAQFVIGVGHDFTANFLNYYLFKDPPLLNGYINLSPDLAPLMDERLPERIPSIETKTFYYLATGTDDVKDLQEISKGLDARLRPLSSENFSYYFDNFEGATHYSLVGHGIPNALEKIFSVYRPISKTEFNDVVMKLETPVNEYLKEKYTTIEELFGLSNPIRINDFIAVATAAEKKSQWEALRDIASMAQRQYPDTVLGDYYMARFYEETGDPKKAMRTYQGGFDKEEVEFITVDLMLDRADRIKEDFGF
ncbi:alpha/beta hydrolase [Altibacter sp. HG106]|uniref:alpha/beta hydrolase n=1 Tax=Altibacter sp. HG106 TaxID=3023937 RepID=UPI0023508122|nr:alpha/beta hydrolase-fold protein [Altibacter sp. HG106]MDC7995183.1 alpha/beta hydrolase-fold protein [Altibacter sp. HG106]